MSIKVNETPCWSDDISTKVFNFVHMKNKKYFSFSDKVKQDLLMKWSMKDQLRVETYAFVEPYSALRQTHLVYDFLRDPANDNTLQGFPGQSSLSGTRPQQLKVTPVKCSATSMTFFDPLEDPENGVVRGAGKITKCMEEDIEGLAVADELRQMLLNPDSPQYNLYSEDQRDEFIYRLFGHLVLGGQWCQYEDELKPYLDVTKAMYKDLVSVCKMKEREELMVTSDVMRLEVKDDHGKVIFPPRADNRQNFVYFIVEPSKRELVTLTHCFGGTFPVVH